MVRPALMHHCFATTERRNNELEVQIVHMENGCIMLMCMALRDFSEK
jgi:hypothetical protein